MSTHKRATFKVALSVKYAVEQILDEVMSSIPTHVTRVLLGLFFFFFFLMRCNSLQSSTEVANAFPAPDVQPLQRFRHQRYNKTQSDFAGGDFKSSGSASCRSSWSVSLWSAFPRMGPRSAFRALLLPACVIICSNVLCPVVAFLYNNRYAGWVKIPPFISGALQSICSHSLLEKRTTERFPDRFYLIRVGYLTDGTKGANAVRVWDIIRSFLFTSVVRCYLGWNHVVQMEADSHGWHILINCVSSGQEK